MKQRTKIEGTIEGQQITIRRIRVDSGSCAAVLCRFQAGSLESAQAEFDGAMAAILAAEPEQAPRALSRSRRAPRAGQCEECARSRGPHFRGRCEH